MSPGIEEQYKALTRDYDNAQNIYRDLLTKKSSSELATNMENQQQGEQMRILNPASLPSDPSFPNRLFFAGRRLGCRSSSRHRHRASGWNCATSRSAPKRTRRRPWILPLLVSVPWVGEEDERRR